MIQKNQIKAINLYTKKCLNQFRIDPKKSSCVQLDTKLAE